MTEAVLDMAMRATGIGASEIGAILGLSPYTSPLTIYLRKLGLVEDSPEPNPYIRWGVRLEPVVAEAYQDETGIALIGDGRTTYRHKEYDFALATPDRIAADHSRLVEIKTTSARNAQNWGESGSDMVPEYVLTQAMWQLAVMDMDLCDVAVLIGGSDFRVFPIRRDPVLEEQLLAVAGDFWRNHVLAQEPPPPRDEAERGRYLQGLYPKHDGDLVEGDENLDRLALALRDVRRTIAEMETQETRIVNDIKEGLGERPGCKGDYGQITWKGTAGRSTIDIKALLAELDVPADTIARHTTTKPGTRRFLPTFKREVE